MDAAIVVDDVRHVVDEVDDFLRRVVGACCFTGEDEDARHPFAMRVFQDLVVTADDVQHVQELPLVFVDALDLYVKEGFGVHFDAEFVFDVLSKATFVFEFDAADFRAEGGIFFERVEFCQLLKVAAPVFTDVAVKHLRKAGVGKRDPAARGNAVRDVGEAFRPEAGKVSKEGFDHEVGVDFGDTVHFMRADDGQPGHAHAAAAFFVNDGDAADEVVIHALFAQFAQEVFVDFEDELQVARQDAADHFYRPAFQRFAHQGVVGVGEDFLTGRPGVVPLDGVFVDQDTHQFGDSEHGVGIVQVDGNGLGEVGQVVVFFEVTAHDVLHRGGDEEVFLTQAQFAADGGGVVRVEDARDVFRGVLFFDGGEIIAFVEVTEVEDVARVCPPQAQGVGDVGVEAGDDLVIGQRGDLFAVVPDALLALVVDVAAEADGVALAGAAELPGDVLLGPGIGLLDLFAVLDDLAEHAVFVADAVTDGGDAQGGEAVHEAGGKAAEATVTKAGIAFFGDDFIDVLPQFSERFAHGVIDVFGDERVRQGATHQEFHREVIDAA